MDIAETTRNLLRPIGYAERNNSNGNIINAMQRIVCSVSCLFIALPALWCILFENEAFSEKTKAVMAFICGFTNLVLYMIMLWQRKHVLKMFDKLQAVARSRERLSLGAAYTEANIRFAKMARIASICMFDITVPSFIFPTMVQSFVEYYVFDHGSRSFRLAFNVS